MYLSIHDAFKQGRKLLFALTIATVSTGLTSQLSAQGFTTNTANSTPNTTEDIRILTGGTFGVEQSSTASLMVTNGGGAMPTGYTAGIGIELSRADGSLGSLGNGIHSANMAGNGDGLVLNGRNWMRYTSFDGDILFDVSDRGSFAFNGETDNSHMGAVYSGPNNHARGVGFAVYQTRSGPSAIGAIFEATGQVNGHNTAARFEASGATNNYAITVPNGGGLVGIGTIAPTKNLEVTSTTNVGVTGNATTEIRLQAINQATSGLNPLGSTWDLRANSVDGDLTFVNSSTDHGSNQARVTFADDGMVGINTTNPGDNYVSPNLLKLDVDGHGRFGSSTDYVRVTGTSIDHYGPNKLHLNYFSHQDVAIGDPSAQQKSTLTVSGDITNCGKLHTTEVEVRSSWCDYVFDEDYDLMSIEELDQYLEENHHLPGIPSAKTVEEEGLKMADMQRRMMEKIEELSLYVIELNERVKEVEAENAVLKANK